MKYLSFLYTKHTSRFTALCLTFIFIVLVGLNGKGQTITSIATGNWNNVDTWLSANLTGTITTATNSTTVTGVGTTFTTQLAIGSKLYRTNGTTLIGTVSSITNNTSLVLTANAANTNSGAGFRARKIPLAANPVVIAAHTVTVTTAAAASSLRLQNGTTVLVNSAITLTVTSGITLANSITANTTAILSGSGTISAASLTVINTDGNGTGIFTTTLNSNITTLNISGNIRINSNRGNSDARLRNGVLNITSGNVNVGGGITTSNENALNNSTLTLANTPQTGTLKIGGATPFTLSATGTNTITLNGTSAKVEYSRSGNQTVLARAYTNLTLSGTGTKTLGAAVTISGNLSISGAVAGLGTNSFTVNTLTLGGSGVINGTWGSASSSAKYKTSSFTGTGIVTVSTANCGTLPNAPTGATGGLICVSGTTSLSVTNPGAGFTIDWYANPTSGNVLTGGAGTSTFTTPSISATTTYYAETRSTNTNCVSASRTAVTATVNALPAAPTTGTITQPTCATATGSVALSGLPASAWTVTASPGGATITGSTATADFSGLTAGTTYTFTVRQTSSGCTSVASGNAAINSQPVTPTAPTVGTITQPTCVVTTGTVALSGLPASAWTITASPGGATITGAASAADFAGLAAGATYTFTVTLTSSGCTSLASGNAVINAQPNNQTANAGPDAAPGIGVPYQLNGTVNNNASVIWAKVGGGSGAGTLDNPTILNPVFTGTNPGAITYRLTATSGCGTKTDDVTLVIFSTQPLTWFGTISEDWNNSANWYPAGVPNSLTNVFIPAGVARFPTINSPGAVCNNINMASDASLKDNGNLTVYGTSVLERVITNAVWHMVSVPNSSTTASTFYGDFLQNWDETQAKWSYINSSSTGLNPVQGYGLWNKGGTAKTYSFTGPFNTGLQQIAISYTSLPTTDNDGANLLGNPYPSYIDWDGLRTTYGAIYYWNGTAYVTWNNGGSGSRYVPPMQGFFIVANAPGTFTLSNTNRAHGTSSYYKSSAEINANSLVLSTSGDTYLDQLFVTFDPATTEGFDLQNDAYKFLSYTAGASELYSFSGDKKLSIDVRPETPVIQLGFTNTLSGEYQIGIDQVADIAVAVLEDTKTNTFHDLITAGPYTFSYTTGESDKRFLLHFGTTSVSEDKKPLTHIYSYRNTAYIDLKDNARGDIFIYNIAGQLVVCRRAAQGINEIKLPNQGNYIVKVISRNSTSVRKVFIQ